MSRPEAVALRRRLVQRRAAAKAEGDDRLLDRIDDKIAEIDVALLIDEEASAANVRLASPNRRGTGGNVFAALCSLFIPGLGQLLQGRIGAAIGHFLLAFILWFTFLGWLIHFYSTYDAATYDPS